MWSAKRRSLQLPVLIALFVACFRFLIFHPFFQGGQLTPFAPMCGRPWLHSRILQQDMSNMTKKDRKRLDRPVFDDVATSRNNRLLNFPVRRQQAAIGYRY